MYNHLNKIKILTFSIAIAIVFCSFLGFNNAYATELCSFTFDSSNNINGSTQYCDNNLSSIKYVEFDFGVDSDTNSMSVTYNTRQYNNQGGRSSYLIEFISLPYSYISAGSGYSDTYPLTVNFYDSLPGSSTPPTGSLSITENGTFDVSEVASVNVNVPQDVTEIIEDPVSNDFHKIFMTVVTGIIPAFAIFVIVWFAIDLMSSLFFGRGK